jgi:hypothetical protein
MAAVNQGLINAGQPNATASVDPNNPNTFNIQLPPQKMNNGQMIGVPNNPQMGGPNGPQNLVQNNPGQQGLTPQASQV